MRLTLVIVLAVVVLGAQTAMSQAKLAWLGGILPLLGCAGLVVAVLSGAIDSFRDALPLAGGILALLTIWGRARSAKVE